MKVEMKYLSTKPRDEIQTFYLILYIFTCDASLILFHLYNFIYMIYPYLNNFIDVFLLNNLVFTCCEIQIYMNMYSVYEISKDLKKCMTDLTLLNTRGRARLRPLIRSEF